MLHGFFVPLAGFLFSYSPTLSDSPTLSEKRARHDPFTYTPVIMQHDIIRRSQTSAHARQSGGPACLPRDVEAADRSLLSQVDVAAAADVLICEEKKAMTAKEKPLKTTHTAPDGTRGQRKYGLPGLLREMTSSIGGRWYTGSPSSPITSISFLVATSVVQSPANIVRPFHMSSPKTNLSRIQQASIQRYCRQRLRLGRVDTSVSLSLPCASKLPSIHQTRLPPLPPLPYPFPAPSTGGCESPPSDFPRPSPLDDPDPTSVDASISIHECNRQQES